jgi:hypothetical protein
VRILQIPKERAKTKAQREKAKIRLRLHLRRLAGLAVALITSRRNAQRRARIHALLLLEGRPKLRALLQRKSRPARRASITSLGKI